MFFILRPSGDSDLAHATIHAESGLPQTISGLAAGRYEIGRIVWAATQVDVVAAVIPVPVATQAPAISGGGKVGAAQIGVDARWDATSAEVESRWTLDGSATGDTDASYLPVAGDDGRVLAFEQRARLAGGAWSAWVASRTVAVSHAAPLAAAPLPARRLTERTGIASVDAAAGFTGLALRFDLVAPPAGVAIDAATGRVAIDTDATGPLAGAAITVRASNSGGQATSGFALDVVAAPAWSVSGGAEAITVAALPTPAIGAATGGAEAITIAA